MARVARDSVAECDRRGGERSRAASCARLKHRETKWLCLPSPKVPRIVLEQFCLILLLAEVNQPSEFLFHVFLQL
jgi:hypothetical protein